MIEILSQNCTWMFILTKESTKKYMILTEEEIGDGDTYVLGDLMDDGWEVFCDLCHTHKQAVKYMDDYFPEYALMKYQIIPITFKVAKAFIDKYHRHHVAPQGYKFAVAATDGEIILGGGHMTVPQLEALLNTLPIEITFVDDNNINRFFNEGPKVFKRPQMAIDREVFSCHPPKIEAMVRAILDDFRNNKRDRVPVWMEKNGKPFLVTYMAVRDKKGNYLGTVEVVQDMQFAKEHFEQ